MSVADVIAERKASGGALIGYLPVGFPDLDTSVEAALTLLDNGVDAVELGAPYSDPVMDGPVIQEATEQARAKGFRFAHVLEAVSAIRERSSAPVLVMAYWNLVLQYGVDRFADDFAAAGGTGLITPDLIPDEAGEWIAASERTGLDRVFLAAPSSSDARLKSVVASSRGFVYTVSTMGVTGERHEVDAAARTLVSRLRAAGVEHACVGLGISTAQQVRSVLDYADGAIVGSAFVAALGAGGLDALGDKARELSSGARQTR